MRDDCGIIRKNAMQCGDGDHVVNLLPDRSVVVAATLFYRDVQTALLTH